MNPCNVEGDPVLAITSPSALDGLFVCSLEVNFDTRRFKHQCLQTTYARRP